MKLVKLKKKEITNTKHIENYNFAKIAAVLADYGFCCLRLSDDWNGADFLAVHYEGRTLKVQLKGRFSFAKKYIGKDIYIAFPVDEGWYLYPHDELLEECKQERITFTQGGNDSWELKGEVRWPKPLSWATTILAPYFIPTAQTS